MHHTTRTNTTARTAARRVAGRDRPAQRPDAAGGGGELGRVATAWQRQLGRRAARAAALRRVEGSGTRREAAAWAAVADAAAAAREGEESAMRTRVTTAAPTKPRTPKK